MLAFQSADTKYIYLFENIQNSQPLRIYHQYFKLSLNRVNTKILWNKVPGYYIFIFVKQQKNMYLSYTVTVIL